MPALDMVDGICGALGPKQDRNIRRLANDPYNEGVVIEEGFLPVLECDYDEGATVLYRSITERRWVDAFSLLVKEEEVGSKNFFTSLFTGISNENDDPNLPQCKIQAMTWVIRKNEDGSIKWRQTPLHAAVNFNAPMKLLSKLLRIHPDAVRLRDDRGNLPLHLAFRNGLQEEKIALLAELFPDGVNAKNNRGKTPLECDGDGKRGILTVVLKATEAEKEKADQEMERREAKLRRERDAEIDKIRDQCEGEIVKLRDEFRSRVAEIRSSASKNSQ